MANYVSNDITVVGNEKVQERMNQYIEALENLEKYSDTGGFASTFYKDPNVSDGGGETIDYKEEAEEETV